MCLDIANPLKGMEDSKKQEILLQLVGTSGHVKLRKFESAISHIGNVIMLYLQPSFPVSAVPLGPGKLRSMKKGFGQRPPNSLWVASKVLSTRILMVENCGDHESCF